MSAIATLLLTFVQPGDVVVHSGPLYAATETLIAKILGRFGVSYLDFPAGATREEIDAVIAKAKEMGRVSLIYLESPANPTNALVDVEAVARRAQRGLPGGEPPADRDRQHLPRPAVGAPDFAGRGHQRLQPDQICRRPQRPGRRRTCRAAGPDRPDPHDAEHDRHDLRSEHRLDAAAQP